MAKNGHKRPFISQFCIESVYASAMIKCNTLPFKMFGPFWSVWCKMALAEVGVSLP